MRPESLENVPEHSKAGLMAMNANPAIAEHPGLLLAGQPADPDAILGQYLQGEKTEDIALTFGVTRQGLGHWLRQHAEEQWKQAQVVLAVTRKEDAEAELDRIKQDIANADKEQRARLKLSLACAEKSLQAAQWDLERTARRLYGPSIAVDMNLTIDLGDRLRRARERVIEQPEAPQQLPVPTPE